MERQIPVPLLPPWLRWLGVIAVAAVIFYTSVIVVPPEMPKPEFAPLDKWLHFLAYAGLGWSLAYATVGESDRRPLHKALLVFSVVFGYGLGIEVIQSFLPYRYFGFGDLVANGIGAALGLTWIGLEKRMKFVRAGLG
ncbi:MAG: VanZ family protein [Halobacteria archaeon]|nr:VanZ family protein [Halobacteria archaeon]